MLTLTPQRALLDLLAGPEAGLTDDFTEDPIDRSGAVTLAAISAFLLVFGIGSLCFAPGIQRAGLKMVGQPRDSLAAWFCKIAASKTSLQSIRWTGALCIAAGVALAFLLVA